MKLIKTLVVISLLSIGLVPAAAHANSPAVSRLVRAGATAPARMLSPSALLALGTARDGSESSAASEAATLAAREQAAPNLETFRGGGASIYLGGGTAVVLAVLLLIILL